MEVLQATAKMQQSQTSMPKPSGIEGSVMQSVQQIQKAQINQDQTAQLDNAQRTNKVDSQEKMDQLIEKLNRSLDPFNTSLRFGFDNQSDAFYVSVIETQTQKILRRFPAEQAEQLLPKMEEVTGILFDQKG